MKRKINVAVGKAALQKCANSLQPQFFSEKIDFSDQSKQANFTEQPTALESPQKNDITKADLQLAVRYTLEEFASRYPGGSLEIRIPWIGAVQAVEGLNHRRGTPPNVIEMSGIAWLELVLWGKFSESEISYSGTRSQIWNLFPLPNLY